MSYNVLHKINIHAHNTIYASYKCMCICMSTCTFMCTCMYMYAHARAQMHDDAYLCLANVCMHSIVLCICMSICKYMHKHNAYTSDIHTYIYIYINIFKYSNMHTYTYIYIYIYIYVIGYILIELKYYYRLLIA